MTVIDAIALETPDPAAAAEFYDRAFGETSRIRVLAATEPSSGFRGFTLSLVVGQPSTVDSLTASALQAGATTVKPPKGSFWGYGSSLQAPDGTVWTIATSSKKETGAATRAIDQIVLLLGVGDVKASRQFYVEHGLRVGKSFGSKYVEFAMPDSPIQLALQSRRAVAKNAGVSAEGTGAHRIRIGTDGGSFTDPDGFAWHPASTLVAG